MGEKSYTAESTFTREGRSHWPIRSVASVKESPTEDIVSYGSTGASRKEEKQAIQTVRRLAQRLDPLATAEEWAEEFQWAYYHEPLLELAAAVGRGPWSPEFAQRVIELVVRRRTLLSPKSVSKLFEELAADAAQRLLRELDADPAGTLEALLSETREGPVRWGTPRTNALWRTVLAWLRKRGLTELARRAQDELYEMRATQEQKRRRNAFAAAVHALALSLTLAGDYPERLAEAVRTHIHRRYLDSALA